MRPSSSLNPRPTVLPPLKPASTGSQISSRTSESTLPRRFAVSRARPYAPHLTPLSSPFRQHIPAKERLFGWTPASSSRVPLAGPIPADMDRIRDVLTFAWADGTLETYGSGLLVYHVFCDNKRVTERDRCPAPALLISAFVSTLSGSYAGSTVTGYVSAVRAWHIIHGASWTMKKDELDALLRAAERLQPPSSKTKKRLPYTVEIIEDLLSHLDLSTALDCAVAACLTTTFYSAARLGEFTVRTLTSFNPTIHVKPSDVRKERDRNNLEQTAFFLPSTKSAPQGESVFWSRQIGPSNPEALFTAHLALNKSLIATLELIKSCCTMSCRYGKTTSSRFPERNTPMDRHRL
ncbi:hypothetical protein BDZ89DRAFT_948463 [Hymenopellis radicata]|nr:hypothetical protein BDZ89DRAFT_948463 [Hymenopellis radicata]